MIPCRAAWESVHIGLDGAVTFCEVHRRRGPELVLGNLRIRSLEEILNGPAARAIRRRILADELPEVCRGCPIWEAERRRLEEAGSGEP